jgi:hypothetical protein
MLVDVRECKDGENATFVSLNQLGTSDRYD